MTRTLNIYTSSSVFWSYIEPFGKVANYKEDENGGNEKIHYQSRQNFEHFAQVDKG